MSAPDSDHDLADSLLPWFVNGTLSAGEHKLVERHAAGCDECRDNIALLASVRHAVGEAQPTPMVPQPKPEVLARAIDARRARPGARGAWWAAAASLGAVALISALFILVRERAPEQPLLFETAFSNSRPLPMDYVFSVRFDNDATAADRERVLKDIGARHVSATADPFEYRVIVALPAVSLEDLERYTNRLESMPEIQAAKAIALHLPVSRPQ